MEYKGIHLDCGYRVDLLVEDKLIIELKRFVLLRALRVLRGETVLYLYESLGASLSL